MHFLCSLCLSWRRRQCWLVLVALVMLVSEGAELLRGSTSVMRSLPVSRAPGTIEQQVRRCCRPVIIFNTAKRGRSIDTDHATEELHP